MADEPENLVLEYLRRFDDQMNRLHAKADRLSQDIRDITARIDRMIDTLHGGVRE